ncbi:aquaporin AQPcic isoform X2 [Orussus abietinus]|uniref:aquaporin AQPcic isoform X2 n=1 Tax=Orussus abietinus TaxID=222816 RepID=UPI0006250683|nr:aquaporin AQPcic isoform X2 [Orussus abietinus]
MEVQKLGTAERVKRLIKGDGVKMELLLTGVAELIGTAILMFFGCMGCLGSFGVAPPHFQVTVTFGFVVIIIIQCFGHISHAHVNPAITLCSVILGKKSLVEAGVYFVAQVLGSILGFGLLKVVTPKDHLHGGNATAAASFCVTDLNENVSAFQGLVLEGLSTATLILLACAIWDKRNEKNMDSVAIKFGLAVTGLGATAGPFTGCSMNPVRSLAPAIWNNQWSHHWIYWLGPLGGSLVASLGYRSIFAVNDDEVDEELPESIALNSVDTQKIESIN